MKVEQILQSKGVDVFAVKSGDLISDAVSMLSDKNIGAVIVKDDNDSVVGILSERDVVRRLGEKGKDSLTMRVSECMTPDPYTCPPSTTLDEVMGMMTQKRIRHLPVTENNKLVGVISIGDVVKRKIELAEQEAAALKEYIAS